LSVAQRGKSNLQLGKPGRLLLIFILENPARAESCGEKEEFVPSLVRYASRLANSRGLL
jgi:hypothetical protein